MTIREPSDALSKVREVLDRYGTILGMVSMNTVARDVMRGVEAADEMYNPDVLLLVADSIAARSSLNHNEAEHAAAAVLVWLNKDFVLVRRKQPPF